jgi:hypothetical protein
MLAAGTAGCLFPSPLPAQRPSLTGPGVSATLARLRAAQVTDVAYDLALTVSAGDTATGRVTVSFTQRTSGDVVLDFRGLSVSDGRINGTAWPALGGAWNRHHLVIPAARLRRTAEAAPARDGGGRSVAHAPPRAPRPRRPRRACGPAHPALRAARETAKTKGRDDARGGAAAAVLAAAAAAGCVRVRERRTPGSSAWRDGPMSERVVNPVAPRPRPAM